MPACRAASMPAGLSSTTMQSCGRTPIPFAAWRNRSGAGLPRATSVALKIRPSNRSRSPVMPSVAAIRVCVPLDATQVGHMLYHESGLAGVSGISPDVRVLLQHESSEEAARDALALYVRRIVREIGGLTALLGGLDLLVFTAGVGEHSAPIRERVCRDLGFLGIRLDDAANAGHAPLVSAAGSNVTVGVEPANEEWIAARAAARLLDGIP